MTSSLEEFILKHTLADSLHLCLCHSLHALNSLFSCTESFRRHGLVNQIPISRLQAQRRLPGRAEAKTSAKDDHPWANSRDHHLKAIFFGQMSITFGFRVISSLVSHRLAFLSLYLAEGCYSHLLIQAQRVHKIES